MADHYYDHALGSCPDFWSYLECDYDNGGTARIRLYNASGSNISLDSSGADAIAIFGSAGWVHSYQYSALSDSLYYTYGVYGAVVLGPSSVVAQARFYSCQGFYRQLDFVGVPGAPDDGRGANSIVTYSATRVAEGDTITCTIVVRDQYNRFKTSGGDLVTVVQGSSNDETVSPVTDHNDGSYSFTITKPTAGYKTFSLQVNGENVPDAFWETIYFDAASTYNPTQGFPSSVIFDGANATVTLRKKDGSLDTTDQSKFIKVFCGGGAEFGPVIYNGDGTYTAPLITEPVLPGDQLIYAFYSSEVIGGSFTPVSFVTVDPVPSTSRAVGLQLAVNGPVPTRDLGLELVVNDTANADSFPVPGGANQAIPRFSSWSIK